MNIIDIKLADIHPYEHNPRRNDEAVMYVKNSIKEFGMKVPLVVDKNNVIVAGHTRYQALMELGWESAPCLIADDLTEEQVKAFRLADNRVGEISTWDLQKLDEELAGISEIDMTQFKFLDEELAGAEEQEVEEDDFDEEPPEEPKSKLGDIYQLGEHRLMCGDSTNAEHVAKLMDGAKADMVFTDPPYNVNYGDKNSALNSLDGGNRIQDDIENDHSESDDEAKKDLWEPAFRNMADNADDYCSIYVTMPQGGAHMMMMMAAAAASWQVKHELVWVKNNHVLGRVDYLYKHEPILFGWKNKHKFYGKGEHTKSVWEIAKPQKSELHPTMKPIELIANALLNSSQEGDSILDVFGGSGSTLIACEQLNRKCFMMELSPKYIDVIITRWEKLTGKKAVKVG